MTRSIAIIGGGGWGTALSVTIDRIHSDVRLWVYEPDLVDSMERGRVNDVYLPGVAIPPRVRISGSLEEVARDADIVVSAMPSHFVRAVWKDLCPFVRPDALVVSATKGIENGSLMRMTEVIEDATRGRLKRRVAALSGPTFALEVARGSPTALVVASRDAGTRRELQQALTAPRFRLYTNADIVGVEIGASVKNIIAIAAGIVSGLEFGHNTTAAIITRGLAEIMRLAEACGGKRETLAGLAGLGDLVLTCTGQLSRNRQVGVELGKGRSVDEIISNMRMVAEGIRTSESTIRLAERKGVEMPIAQQVYEVLYDGKNLDGAIAELMERELKEE